MGYTTTQNLYRLSIFITIYAIERSRSIVSVIVMSEPAKIIIRIGYYLIPNASRRSRSAVAA
jgi:hypothetical protein